MSIIKELRAAAARTTWQTNCIALFGMRLIWQGVGLIILFALCVGSAFAQGAAEYGTITSGMASSMSGINLMNKASFPATSSAAKSATVLQRKQMGAVSPYIVDSLTSDEAAVVNRRALEEHAGKEAAKLMLRSTPLGANVRLNGKTVGKTPLLLIVAPGQYTVTMDGARLEQSERKVDLLPHETREFVFALKVLYPTRVELNLH